MKKNISSNSDIKNPNNDAYWLSRGYSERPHNWKGLVHNDISNVPYKTGYPDDGGIVEPLSKDDY